MKSTVMLLAAISAAALLASQVAVAESQIKVSKKDCKRIVRHSLSASAEYKPGVDARGRRVAPADLGGGSQIQLPKEITIDIGIDLDEKYGLGAGGKYTGLATLGQVKVRGGNVYWNGKRLGGAEQSGIAEACRKMYGK